MKSALERFLHTEAASGIALLIVTAVALVWANSPAAASYHALWHAPISVTLGGRVFAQPLEFGVNDGLMTIFFLVVGLEIRRELHSGALAGVRAAALPLVAAAGGVLAPALIYLLWNGADPALRAGWAVPTATDIAFAVGVLALLGKRIAPPVRALLLALAVIDDIFAIAVIAFVYTSSLAPQGLLLAATGVVLVIGLQKLKVQSAWAFVLPGAILWFGLLWCGIHPTLAGVVLGLMTPPAPIDRVQGALHPWVAFGIMPLFALANAGVDLGHMDLSDAAAASVATSTGIALFAGKPVGIFALSYFATRLGICALPPSVTWRAVALVGLLGGIGFTMAIFIASLAFDSPALLEAAKLGILAASALAAVAGLLFGALFLQRPATQPA